MKLLFKKSFGGVLLPADAYCEQAMQKVKNDDEIIIEYKKRRNGQFHKKGFFLLKLIFDNQDRFDIFDNFFVEVKILAGHYDEHITVDGKIVFVPKSISFAEMDNLKFQEFYEKIKTVANKFGLSDDVLMRVYQI